MMKIKAKQFEKLVRADQCFYILNEQTHHMIEHIQRLTDENEELKALNDNLMCQIEELEERLEAVKADVQAIKDEQEE